MHFHDRLRHFLAAFAQKSFHFFAYYAIIIILLAFTIAHSSVFLSIYLSGDTSLTNEVLFHDSDLPLKFPSFAFCFSKLYTYNKLRSNEVKWLYEMESNSSSVKHSDMDKIYNWRPNISDLILSITIDGTIKNRDQSFHNIFITPGDSCWVITGLQKMAYQPGPIHSLDLVVNAAVYDDLSIAHSSSLTYLKIVPYFKLDGNDNAIPDMSNSVSVSTGRFSSIGFRWKKLDSTHRNKYDARQCVKGMMSQQECRTYQMRRLFQNKCSLVPNDLNSSARSYYACTMQPTSSNSKCFNEPCIRNVFEFKKSEAHIKFNNRLSVLSIDSSRLDQIRNKLALASDLHTQRNTDVKNSFRNIADGVGALTDHIVVLLRQEKAHRCKELLNSNFSFTFVDNFRERLPSVVVEKAYIDILRHTFLTNSKRMYNDVVRELTHYIATGGPYFEKTTPYILLHELKNTKNHLSLESMDSIEILAKTFVRVSELYLALHEKASGMLANYESLQFTKFITRYSNVKKLVRYNHLLQRSISATLRMKNQLFVGNTPEKGYFAHDDEKLKTIFRIKGQGSSMKWPSTYANDYWLQSNWLFHKRMNHTGLHSPWFVEGIFGHYPEAVEIPMAVKIYCYVYINYVAKAERFHGAETSLSLTFSYAKSYCHPDVVIFILNNLLTFYETSSFFVIRSDGLVGAERKSCLRLSGYPIYVDKNGSYASVINKFDAFIDRTAGFYEPGKVYQMKHLPERDLIILDLLRNYHESQSSFETISEEFHQYYESFIPKGMTSATHDAAQLYRILQEHQQLQQISQLDKIYLISELKYFANLSKEAACCTGEAKISRYLNSKGTMLVNQLQLEISLMQNDLLREQNLFVRKRQVTRKIKSTIYGNDTFKQAILRAVLSSAFHPDIDVQDRFIKIISDCNDNKWALVRETLSTTINALQPWIVNASAMVRRARRYQYSLKVNKPFMRRNMIQIALYYDSMEVLVQTNRPVMSLDDLFANLGGVADIYLGITACNTINAVVYVIPLLLDFVWRRAQRLW